MEKATIDSASNAEEEYVLLDLGDVSLLDIPPNAPYVLSGLDTMNPVLTICDKFKMIGEYEETIGTCLTFAEDIGKPMSYTEFMSSNVEEVPVVEEEAQPSETNGCSREAAEPKQATRKELKATACVHKILKFKLLDSDVPSPIS
ncbi:general transcription factor 3C polypeptide 6-like [Cucumis melo var. makuwa]|uniref:General transcription factor 3C polypeptide 6-like n=1 Tax=Cucumis melo var. makuwa TaxID=1194695 RepID=A0A5A7USU8_CUCMM|nr:general transcription factor 3C polypeptide 6-like [Cucumis melo var. makuwa]TYK24253.1 general transcription factor 3C polypeptide 6-like [Cucumis melo var. makuwa]